MRRSSSPRPHPPQHEQNHNISVPPLVTVAAVNTGKGGLKKHFPTILNMANDIGASIIVVSEALPDAAGVNFARHPSWQWVTQRDCSIAAASGPQALGDSESGGTAVIVRSSLAADESIGLLSAVPIKTPAADIGDVTIATVTYGRGRSRWRINVCAAYLLPTSSTSSSGARVGCGDDQHCTNANCRHQHAVSSLNAALVTLNDLSSSSTTTLLAGDLNTHIVGPTAPARLHGSSHPNDKARVNAVSTCLHNNDFLIVNDYSDGRLPQDVQYDHIQATRLPQSRDPPATLDLFLLPSEQANRVSACVVHPWPRTPDFRDLDHATVAATVPLSCVQGQLYEPSPGAADVQVQRAPPAIVYRRLPADHKDWQPVVAALEQWVSQHTAPSFAAACAAGAGAGVQAQAPVQAAAPVLDDIAATVQSWDRAVATASLAAGVAATRVSRRMRRDGSSLDGRVAATARVVSRLRRRVATLQRDHQPVPGGLLQALQDAQSINHQALNARRRFAADAAAEFHEHVMANMSMGSNFTSAAGKPVLPLGVVCGTRMAKARVAAMTVNPQRLHGASTARQAVQEWVVALRDVDARRTADGRHASPDIAAQYEALRSRFSDRHWQPSTADKALNAPFTEREMRSALQHAKAGTGILGPPLGVFKALAAHFDSAAAAAQQSAADLSAPDAPRVGRAGAGVVRVSPPPNPFLHFLTRLANSFLTGTPLPADLTTLALRPIHKKGPPESFDSWRLLCPGHGALWVVLYAVAARLSEHLEGQVDARLMAGVTGTDADRLRVASLPDTQCGFRRGRGTLEALLLSEEVTALSNSGYSVYANLYFDLTSAFDAVRRDAVGVALDAHGVRGPMWLALVTLLDCFALRVQFTGLQACEPVRMGTGVVQGSPVAPCLFLVAISSLHRAIAAAAGPAAPLRPQGSSSSGGGGGGGNAGLSSLFFADDFVALAMHDDWPKLRQALQRIANAVCTYLRARGMRVNVRPDGTKTCLALSVGRGTGPHHASKEEQVWAAATANPVTIDGVSIPLLPPDGTYKYLGLSRRIAPHCTRRARRLTVTRGTTHHAKTTGLVAQAKSLRGRVVAAGFGLLPLRACITAYKALMLPSISYAMGVWCVSPSFLPSDVTKFHKANILSLAGTGAHTSVPSTNLETAFGLLPVWALPMREQATLVARVLALHPNHDIRRASRVTFRRLSAQSTTTGGSWWTHVVGNFNAASPDNPMGFIIEDLRNDSPPTLTSPSPPHIWRRDQSQRGTDGTPPLRSVQHLRSRVDALVRRCREWYWRCPGVSRPPPAFCVPTRSGHTGSSFEEVRHWFRWAQLDLAFPLSEGARCDAQVARMHALGGVSAIVDGRNFHLVRDRNCLICNVDGSTNTLTHLICACTGDARGIHLPSVRRTAYNNALDGLHALDDEAAGTSTWSGALDVDIDHMNDSQRQDWVSFVLGVPLQRFPAQQWERCWYSRHPPCPGPLTRRFRRIVLSATATLVCSVVHLLQEAVWDLRRIGGDNRVVLPKHVHDQHLLDQREAQRPTVAQRFNRRVYVRRWTESALQPGNGAGVGAGIGAGAGIANHSAGQR